MTIASRRTAALLLSLGAMNVLALTWWSILGFDSEGSIARLRGLRIAAPMLLAVFFPVVGAVVWRFRRRGAGLTNTVRAYILISIAFLALSWVPAAGVTALAFWMEEPWPLSLQQGPDTATARAVFHRNFGVEPSVSNVFARVEWDGTMYLAFSFEDQAVVDRIVERRSLRPSTSTEISGIVVKGPDWFPRAEERAQIPDVYAGDSARVTMSTVVWVDRVRRRVFFLSFGG